MSGPGLVHKSRFFRDDYLKGTQGEFKKCYFMFSSQTDQYSYQDNYLSFFTKSIIESIFNHKSTTVRYKDVIDYVSDSFSENTSQTPFFIVQAEFTEPFCTISETLKRSLEDVLKNNNGTINTSEENKEQTKTLLDLVKIDAEKYCTEEESMEYLKNFITCINQSELNSNVSELYELIYTEENEYSEIPSSSSIGKWLASNDHSYFAKPFKKEVTVRTRVLRDPARGLLGDIGIFGRDVDDEECKYVTKKENQILGFRSTVDLPVKLIKITAEAKYPNISPASAYIVPIISKTELRVFFSFNFYEQQGWNDKKITGSVNWATDMVGLANKEGHAELSKRIMSDFSQFIYSPIAEKFGLTEGDEDQEEENADEESEDKA